MVFKMFYINGLNINSIQFSLFYTAQNYKCASAGFTICTRTISLTFDLSHRIRKNSQEIEEKKLSQGKKVKNPSGEQQKRIPLQDKQMSCDQNESSHIQ